MQQLATYLPQQLVRRDARDYQILFLSAFLIYGILFLDWTSSFLVYSVAISFCLATQFFWLKKLGKNMHGLKSGLITALGLCLLLKVSNPAVMALASVVAISSKFLIRYDGKHIFNPANIGIIIAILLTNNAWVSPGQWGSSAVLVLFFGTAAIMVLLKVGRIDTSIAFLATLFGLEFIRNVIYKGWELDFVLHQFTSGTILLFAFFMITDPRTTPNDGKARFLWAAGIAVVSFGLSSVFQLYTAPIWALFFISPVTVLLDKIFINKKFQWL